MAQWKITAEYVATGNLIIEYFSAPDATSMRKPALTKARLKAKAAGIARIIKRERCKRSSFRVTAINCVG